jgi:hypothetical protein
VDGLTESDQVILQPDASVAEGAKVEAQLVSVPPTNSRS